MTYRARERILFLVPFWKFILIIMIFRSTLITLLLGVVSLNTLRACDACACSILFMDMGITPRFQQHQLGLQWRHQTFRSYASHEDKVLKQIGSQERYDQWSIQLQWQLHKRWQFSTQLPYMYAQRTLDGQTYTQNGLADVITMVQYVLVNQNQKPTQSWRHRLAINTGVKLPVGKNTPLSTSAENPNFRLGSGSWDGLFGAQYVLRYRKWGLVADALFTRTSSNEDEYRYGNRWNGNARLFTVMSTGKVGWMPSIGVNYERAEADVQRGFYRSHTGGHYTLWRNELQVFLPKYSFSIQHQLPLHQHWGGGLTEANARWALQWTVFL